MKIYLINRIHIIDKIRKSTTNNYNFSPSKSQQTQKIAVIQSIVSDFHAIKVKMNLKRIALLKITLCASEFNIILFNNSWAKGDSKVDIIHSHLTTMKILHIKIYLQKT